LIKCNLRLDTGTSCEVYLQGAHVTSFKTETGEELLFLSSKSNFALNKPIRGGIPVIFPQFGPGKLKQHGFARDSNEWKVVNTGITHNQLEQIGWITLNLSNSASTLQIWPNHFSFTLTIKITYDSINGSQLHQEMEVINQNQTDPFDFTSALHTYFTVSSIHETTVSNLQNISYFDKITQTNQIQSNPAYSFHSETDKIFSKAPENITIKSPEKSVQLFRRNFPDIVVWNIWDEKIKSMSDMAPDEWKNYVCVESGSIAQPVILHPNQTWRAQHYFSKNK